MKIELHKLSKENKVILFSIIKGFCIANIFLFALSIVEVGPHTILSNDSLNEGIGKLIAFPFVIAGGFVALIGILSFIIGLRYFHWSEIFVLISSLIVLYPIYDRSNKRSIIDIISEREREHFEESQRTNEENKLKYVANAIEVQSYILENFNNYYHYYHIINSDITEWVIDSINISQAFFDARYQLDSLIMFNDERDYFETGVLVADNTYFFRYPIYGHIINDDIYYRSGALRRTFRNELHSENMHDSIPMNDITIHLHSKNVRLKSSSSLNIEKEKYESLLYFNYNATTMYQKYSAWEKHDSIMLFNKIDKQQYLRNTKEQQKRKIRDKKLLDRIGLNEYARETKKVSAHVLAAIKNQQIQ